ncbi:MAG TPA: DinB family protein [Candidatus Dormibacteraeota bacterium]|nr:DinB family protein [Candidatus Dormibacteraeota bacterium]
MTTRTDQGEVIARDMERAMDELVQLCRDCTEKEWQTSTQEEGWPIGTVAHHVGVGAGYIIEMVRRMATGGVAGESMDELHALNASHAEKAYDREDTAAFLDQIRRETGLFLRSMTDRDLETVGWSVGKRARRSAGEQAQILVSHVNSHLESIRSTRARS